MVVGLVGWREREREARRPSGWGRDKVVEVVEGGWWKAFGAKDFYAWIGEQLSMSLMG